MAIGDLQTFLQERLAAFDETIDLTPGSPADNQVVQPLLRRLGSDPFTIDMGVFIQDRLNQEFPDLPTKEGDAITDLLIKPALILWDPIVREIYRVRQQLSFRDPTILTLDEADALGANLFTTREMGDTARGTVRIYFSFPQSITVSPANFVTSKGGLHFFPTQSQSISAAEMIFNLENSLYYFDVTLIAEVAGDTYNIGIDELITIANVSAAVRLTNKAPFRFGMPAESAVDFIARAEQDLTERSMVTERGIVAKIAKSFTEVTRIGVTGFNDPEMNRDIIKGGGLGPIRSGGTFATAIPDGEGAATTRRVSIDTASEGIAIDFTALIAPPGQLASDYVITLFNAFNGVLPSVRDLKVLRVVNATTVDLIDQVLQSGNDNLSWSLRKNELTLSGIPGGILFPNTSDGTVSIPDDEIHIGGATDVFVRGSGLDDATVVLQSIVDDSPLLQGQDLRILDAATIQLDDLILGIILFGRAPNYSAGDSTWTALNGAVGLNLQIMDDPAAGTYRVLTVTQASPGSPVLTVTPALPLATSTSFRWKLLDELDIDLVEPKETKISGSDLRTVQGSDTVDTESGADFDSYGVGAGDILRILSGTLVIGDYGIKAVLSPFFERVQVDKPLPATASNLQYTIFRPNQDGGIALPFVRIDTIDLLDTSNQPVGTTIPYANPIDIRSRSFANAAHGVKRTLNNGILGLVSIAARDNIDFDLNGRMLQISWDTPTATLITINFTAPCTTMQEVVDQINEAVEAQTSGEIETLAVLLPDDAPYNHVGIVPVGGNTRLFGGNVIGDLFGYYITANSIRDNTENIALAINPPVDPSFDVAQVQDGLQIGVYPNISLDAAGVYLLTQVQFQPEIKRRIVIGSPSFGSARLYFLEPTSISLGQSTVFTVDTGTGTLLFRPDPTLSYQRLPPLPDGTKSEDGVMFNSTLTSASSTFIKSGTAIGDVVVIDYQPLTGTVVLADPVIGLAFTTLTISLGGGIDKDIIFVQDDVTLPTGAVSRAGVAKQINKIVGQTICSITGANNLEFEADVAIIVRGTGSANAILGFPTTDTSDFSPNNQNPFVVVSIPDENTLNLNIAGNLNTDRQQFKVFRPGLQRIIATQMSKNVAETGLYYVDIELVSLGTGDQYNIDAGVLMTATGYQADGYYLTSDDPNLTFSPAEKVHFHVSPTILEVGTSDDPDNATALSGQNLQINYERSAVVGSVQNFMMSETERVVCQSPLARHLIPYFVRFDAVYSGGSQESEVQPDVERFINGLNPDDFFEVSDLERLISARGAQSISNPITLLAVIHNFDRSISMERSQDKINVGSLAAFIPDVLSLTRKLA